MPPISDPSSSLSEDGSISRGGGVVEVVDRLVGLVVICSTFFTAEALKRTFGSCGEDLLGLCGIFYGDVPATSKGGTFFTLVTGTEV